MDENEEREKKEEEYLTFAQPAPPGILGENARGEFHRDATIRLPNRHMRALLTVAVLHATASSFSTPRLLSTK